MEFSADALSPVSALWLQRRIASLDGLLPHRLKQRVFDIPLVQNEYRYIATTGFWRLIEQIPTRTGLRSEAVNHRRSELPFEVAMRELIRAVNFIRRDVGPVKFPPSSDDNSKAHVAILWLYPDLQSKRLWDSSTSRDGFHCFLFGIVIGFSEGIY